MIAGVGAPGLGRLGPVMRLGLGAGPGGQTRIAGRVAERVESTVAEPTTRSPS